MKLMPGKRITKHPKAVPIPTKVATPVKKIPSKTRDVKNVCDEQGNFVFRGTPEEWRAWHNAGRPT